MIKAEPKSILLFLYKHFNLLNELFIAQSKNGVITKDFLKIQIDKYGYEVERQLSDYKILKEINDDFQIRETYYNLFEFILQQFKPLLPEEIEKYAESISNLFFKIKEGITQDRNILLNRISALSSEIEKFVSQVENNTTSLLNQSRELKANTENIDYEQKIHKASFWIEYYILPLNEILNVTHTQSIYNILLGISEFSNFQRLDYTDENIRLRFERLYNLLKQSQKDLRSQSTILVNELLPLIDRIKTENEILKGMYFYLLNSNCYKKGIEQPKLFSKSRDSIYNPDYFIKTKEYFEQFQQEEEIIIVEEQSENEEWLFDKFKYKKRLKESLPISNFFAWSLKEIVKENKDISTEQYFALSTLLFENDFTIVYANKNEKIIIENDNVELIIPILKVTLNEN